MNLNELKAWIVGGATIFLIVVTIGTVSIINTRIEKETKLEATKLSVEAQVKSKQIVEDAKIERTKERWGSLPFFRKDK